MLAGGCRRAVELERFPNDYVAFQMLLKVAFTSTPSSKDHSLGAPEMKKPLSDCPSLYTNWRTASGGAHQQAGYVIVTAGLIGGFHKPAAQLAEEKIQPQQRLDKRVGDFPGETVGTQ